MVYDQARNIVGDTYCKDRDALYEGDELSLDKGVLIEVAEAMGVTQTDLTPLFEKKTRDPPPRPAVASQTRPFQRPSSVAPSTVQRNATQQRHKSLSTLLGTPAGPMGKAQPIKSPYEARMEKENVPGEERAVKKQKTAHPPPSWRASSPVYEESPVAKKASPPRPKTPAATARKPTPFIPPSAHVITIDSEPDPCPTAYSDVSLPDTPPRVVKLETKPAPMPKPIIKPVVKPALELNKPTAKTPKIPRGKVPVPMVKALETPKRPAPTSSPPVSASNRLTNIDYAVQSVAKPPQELPPQPPSPLRNPKAKSLRLSSGVKRGTLICQTLPLQALRASSAVSKARKSLHNTSREVSPALSNQSTVSRTSTLPKGKRKQAEKESSVAPKRAKGSPCPSEASLDIFDDPEIVHGLMDEQLLVISSPPMAKHPRVSSTVKVPKAKASVAKTTISKDSISHKHKTAKKPESIAQNTKSASPKKNFRKARLPKGSSDKREATKVPLSPLTVHEALLPFSREVSPIHSKVSDTRSRNSSISPSKATLSTGGFRKKPSGTSNLAVSTTPAIEVSAQERRNETVALPPHPLRAGKKGPLMSTTELAALLQKPKRTKRPLNDPIEDDTTSTRKSPNRSFRRVRSENDAPIPSTAEDWEKRNLAKPPSHVTAPGNEAAQEPTKRKPTGLSALIKKTDPRRKFQRTQSLSVNTSVPPPVGDEPDLSSPVVDRDVGPWSTEAFDLFDWRPPREGEA